MTTDQLNAAVRDAHDAGEEVDDYTARVIASYWHDGQSSAFYAFNSSGHYDRDALLRELSRTIEQCYSTAAPADRLQLDMLGTYLINRPQDELFSHRPGGCDCHADDAGPCHG